MRRAELAQAAVFHGPGQPHEIVTAPIPGELRPGERLVRIEAATICGSDLHTVRGDRIEPTPSVLGHEGVGTVIRAAGDVGHSVGQRVTWSSSVGCGSCSYCGPLELPQKCRSVFKYGHVELEPGHELSGTYASHVVLRRGTHVVPVPAAIPASVASTLNCAVATMVAATETTPRRLDSALIQGAGLLGLLGAALLRRLGCPRVLVSDVSEDRLQHVEAFGGEAVAAHDVPGHGEGTLDLIVEACGSSEVVAQALPLLRSGGHYVLVGLVRPGPALEVTGEQLVRGCVTMRGVHNYAPRHLSQAVAFLAEEAERLPLRRLLSDPYPLDAIDDAMEAAATHSWSRVVLQPGAPS